MYPCADGATPLPGICGWRHILRTANFIDVAQEAIETGLSSTPTRCETSQATTQITSCSGLGLRPRFPPRKDRLLGPTRASRRGASRGLQGPQGPPQASGPPGRLKIWACHCQALSFGFRVFPSRKNQCTLYIFGPLGWLEAGLCLPMYCKHIR